jgi:hypothetical protein
MIVLDSVDMFSPYKGEFPVPLGTLGTLLATVLATV